MKKAILLCAGILIFSHSVFGQDKGQATDPKVTIQVNPFLPFVGFVFGEGESRFLLEVETQFKITSKLNLAFGVSWLWGRTVYDEYVPYDRYETHEEGTLQVRFKPMLIYRPFERGLRGFFVGFYLPNVGFIYTYNDDVEKWYPEIGSGIHLGYKWILRNGFTMQIGGGVGQSIILPVKSNNDINMTLNSDGSLRAGSTDVYILEFKMGYSF
ncbi:MAG: hypothetical protein LBI06_06525 [Treponema sp.]|nr:hypothetical protein [Treponema sp.]